MIIEKLKETYGVEFEEKPNNTFVFKDYWVHLGDDRKLLLEEFESHKRLLEVISDDERMVLLDTRELGDKTILLIIVVKINNLGGFYVE